MKYTLVQFTDDSIKYKNIKSGDYVIAKTGFFWKDVFSGSVRECVGLDTINVSLNNGYAKITKEEAEALIEEKKSPTITLEKYKEEIEELKKEIEVLKVAGNEENIKKIAELEKNNEALAKENETLKVKVSELEKVASENEVLKTKIAELEKTTADTKKKAS